MGIDGFYGVLGANFPNAFRTIPKKNGVIEEFDHVVFDVNNLLHTVARRSRGDKDKLLRLLIRNIDAVLKNFPPKKSVFMALDGPAPIAKMSEQRSRRIKTSTSDAISSLRNNEEGRDEISSLNFTPGTEFMEWLKEALCYYAVQRLGRIANSNSDVHYFVSGAETPGEGELKIFQYINQLPNTDGRKEKVLVVGSDSDLVLFCTRADKHSSILKGNFEMIDVEFIKKTLIASTRSPEDAKQLLDDFVYLSLFQGNDYLPKMSGYSFNTAFAYYLRVRKTKYLDQPLYNEKTKSHNAAFLNDILIESCATMEERTPTTNSAPAPKSELIGICSVFLKTTPEFEEITHADQTSTVTVSIHGRKFASVSAANRREASREAALKTLSSPEFMQLLSENNNEKVMLTVRHRIEVCTGEKEYTPYRTIKDITDPPNSGKEKTIAYLEGMVWVMECLNGKCHNYDFFYPFHSAPSLQDIYCYGNHVPTLKGEGSASAFRPLEFCATLLPPNRVKQFLPEQYASLVGKGSKYYELFSHQDGRARFWRVQELQQTVNSLREMFDQIKVSDLDKRHHHRYHHQPTLKFMRTTETNGDFILPSPPLPSFSPLLPSLRDRITCHSETRTGTFVFTDSKYTKVRRREFSTFCQNRAKLPSSTILLSMRRMIGK